MIKQYDNIRKVATGQGDDYQLIAVNLSKQKKSNASSRAVQQIDFYGMLKTNLQVGTV